MTRTIHVANIHRSVRAEGGTRAYFAACWCGWRGPQRTGHIEAAEDASRHDNEQNPLPDHLDEGPQGIAAHKSGRYA